MCRVWQSHETKRYVDFFSCNAQLLPVPKTFDHVLVTTRIQALTKGGVLYSTLWFYVFIIASLFICVFADGIFLSCGWLGSSNAKNALLAAFWLLFVPHIGSSLCGVLLIISHRRRSSRWVCGDGRTDSLTAGEKKLPGEN